MTTRRLDHWIRYARRYGTEFVFETAKDDGLPELELARLSTALAELDRDYRQPGRPPGRPRTYTPIPETDRAFNSCAICGRAIAGYSNRGTCSTRCRVALHRARARANGGV